MSQTTWTCTGYGADETLIDKITTRNAWTAFLELYKNRNKKELEDIMMAYFGVAEDGQIPDEDSFDETDKNEIMVKFYEDILDVCIPSGTIAILADLVARKLHMEMTEIVMDQNEEGKSVVGICSYYPWNTPPGDLKDITEEDCKSIFIQALAELQVHALPDDIDHHSIENWG